MMNEILSDFNNVVTWKAITYSGCQIADVGRVKKMEAKDVYLFAISDMKKRAYEYKDALSG